MKRMKLRMLLPIGVICAGAVVADTSATPTDALLARMTLCQSRMASVEQLMIERLEDIERRFGAELRRKNDLQQMLEQARQKLLEALALYGNPPGRPEHRLYLLGLESEVDNLQRSLAVARRAEQSIALIKPWQSATRVRWQGNVAVLDDVLFAIEECAEQPQCHAQQVEPLLKPLAAALQASRQLLFDAWPPLRGEDVRYPSQWEDDCRTSDL
ncbi:hypothetical protein [Pseudomonas xantholysinigenes]|uniref:Lysozyme inhibitor LprI N-terminal domain-containing protein n=1 Tax=Pseudomonas xantholysinigenes TaxID=2745490 RepID=A0A9E6TVG5_9PSED|nr:hypothetical protein [Pseudomonas xantholysinigenes]QXI36457.1 hypothetical protein HU772_013950 [Pseudomonas xantholysinigenes]